MLSIEQGLKESQWLPHSRDIGKSLNHDVQWSLNPATKGFMIKLLQLVLLWRILSTNWSHTWRVPWLKNATRHWPNEWPTTLQVKRVHMTIQFWSEQYSHLPEGIINMLFHLHTCERRSIRMPGVWGMYDTSKCYKASLASPIRFNFPMSKVLYKALYLTCSLRELIDTLNNTKFKFIWSIKYTVSLNIFR